jgi:fatty-acyl-CoA synthase
MPIRLIEPAAEAYRYPLLIRHLLHTPLACAPGQQIVYRDRRRHDYSTFARRIGQLAGALRRLGVGPGDTVAVMDWDSHRYLECFFAVPMMGAVLQTVNVRLTPEQIAYTLKHAGATVVLLNRDFLELFGALRSAVPGVRRVVLLDDDPSGVAPEWIEGEYEEALAAQSPDFDFQDFDENAVATTFYTTGTTGSPKGVCFSHRQIVLHTLALMAAVAAPAHGQSFRHGDVYMPLTPMFHVHAWGNPFVATLLGVKQVYPGRYSADELLSLRACEGVTFSHCVPTILRMLLTHARDRGISLAGWKLCIGGSALPVGLAAEALDAGIDVFAGYGMSETGPVMTVSRLVEAPRSLGCEGELERRCRTGLPIPLVDLRVVDPEGVPLPRDDRSVGEIVVRSPWTTPCYTGDPASSAELWSGGYLHTRDVGRQDASGYLQVTDRLKDVIKTGGEWISSVELEDVVSTLPGVAEVAVIGVPDAHWGERPLVLIVPGAGAPANLTADAVREHVVNAVAEGRLPRYAVPERVMLVASLARTSVGKVNKRALREQYGS